MYLRGLGMKKIRINCEEYAVISIDFQAIEFLDTVSNTLHRVVNPQIIKAILSQLDLSDAA